MGHEAMCLLPPALLPWYEKNKRQLPWRQDRQPYHVWLSEIMLQQTRVEAVKAYYTRFLEELPTIESLAKCNDEKLYKLWEGLGYYSRARNLKKAAVRIVEHYGGVFPENYEQVRALPGIGDYTAGAVCSICFDAPTPAVDGNVMRLISRITEDATPIDLSTQKRAVKEALEAVYPDRAGDFTQALMELGATLCGPNRKPDCGSCPCRAFCGSAANGTAEHYPVRLPKKNKKFEERTVFIVSCDGSYALEKRPDTGLLAKLWQFPNVSGKLETSAALAAAEQMGLKPRQIYRQVERRHIFTHICWEIRGYFLEASEMTDGFVWMTDRQIQENVALPTAFRQLWEEEDHV